MKKDVCVTINATKNYTAQLASVLMDLQRHSPDLADTVCIFHDGISEEKQEQLSKIGQPLEFIYWNEVPGNTISREILESYSSLVFARFEYFNLLHKYKAIVTMDLDILIQDDISDVLKYGYKSGLAMSEADYPVLNISNFLDFVPGYAMCCPLYNAGLMVIRDCLPNYEKMTEWCYKTFGKIHSLLNWGEQGILNLLLQEFNIEVEEVDIKKYVCHPDRPYISEAVIAHSYGTRKFWNDMGRDHQFPMYRKNLMEWGKLVASFSPQPKVSVVMSVYKRSEFLDEAVQSILAQTLCELELIVVVEKSDNQQAVVEKLRSYEDPRIVIICNEERLGFANSLNVGLEAARGEYIARFDDDDYSVLERLQIQADFLDNNQDIDIVGSFIKVFGNCEDEWNKLATKDEDIKVRLLRETQLYHPTVMMRAASLRKHGLRYDPSYFTEDYALWAHAAKYCKFANIPKFLVRYRASGNQLTSGNERLINNSHLAVMRWQLKEFLHIDATYDELALFSKRINIMPLLHHKSKAKRKKILFIFKVIVKNMTHKFYSNRALIYSFVGYKEGKLKRRLSRLVSKIKKRFRR